MDSVISKHPNKAAGVLGVIAVVLVYIRLEPTLPTIMGDELVYLVQSRHTAPADSTLPNYLFSFVYSSSLLVGVEFYWFIKVINFVFLYGFGAIVFLLAKKVFSFWLALLVALASVVGPVSLYGSVFMPEAMYMFFALLSFYFVLQTPAKPLKQSWPWVLGAGLVLALTSLVKPHALFLLLGFALFYLFSSKWRMLDFLNRALASVTFVGSTVVVKLLGGFLFAGTAGLTLFGGYGSVAGLFQRFLDLVGLGSTSSDSEGSSWSESEAPATIAYERASDNAGLFELFLQQFGLHFLTVGFLLAPVWYVFFSTKFSVKSSIAELSLFSIGTMMIVISAFGAYVTIGGDDHTDRILLRYYEFLIPVVYLGAYQVLKQKHPEGILKYVFFGVFLISAILISANGIASIEPKLSDSSYLVGIFGNLDMRWFYSAALIAVFLFILGVPAKLAQYSATTIALATIFAGVSAQQNQLDINSQQIGPDFAGQYVRDELPDLPGQKIYVVGSDKQLVEASIFWMDRAGVEFELYDSGSVLPDSEIPAGKSVIVQVLGVQIENIEEGDLIEEDWIISYR